MQKLNKVKQQAIEPVDMTNYNSMLPKNLSKNLMSPRQIKRLQGSRYATLGQQNCSPLGAIGSSFCVSGVQ